MLFEQHELSLREPRVTPRVVDQHQREQTMDLRLVGHQPAQQSPQPDRLPRKVEAPSVPLVEDQVHDREHRIEPVWEEMIGGDREGDARLLDLHARSRQPALHCVLRDEERACDLFRGEAAERTQRECDLRLGRERRVAAHEDQLETLVLDERRVDLVHVDLVHRRLRDLELAGLRGKGSRAPDAVDRTVARRRHEPACAVGRSPVTRPALRRDRERLGGGFLGELEVAEEAHQ